MRALRRSCLAVTALALSMSGCGTQGVDDARSTGASPAAEASAEAAAVATRAPGNIVPEVPTAIRLPDRRRVPIAPAGTSPGGRLKVPANPAVAGWWDGGSRPGDPFGSTVIAAHVDAVGMGLGPFASLLDARRGDRVVVTSSRLTTTYRVSALTTIAKRQLARSTSVFDDDGEARLVLITCAGPFDRSRGGYQNLLVLTATPMNPTKERDR